MMNTLFAHKKLQYFDVFWKSKQVFKSSHQTQSNLAKNFDFGTSGGKKQKTASKVFDELTEFFVIYIR